MKKKNKFAKIIILLSVVTLLLTVFLLLAVTKQQQNNQYIEIDPDSIRLIQLEEPNQGDPIAIVETTVGEFRFRLFPEQSPNAVVNFVELAESGFYDDTYVFNSESGVYASMGSVQKNGELPENADLSHERTERELSQDLWTFRGAVCALNTSVDRTFMERLLGGGTYYNGSRFAVLNTVEISEDDREEFLESSENKELGRAYLELGGIPNFAQQMTVIGQTYEGLDVVEKLASLESESNGRYMIPKEEVKIVSVKIAEYGE